ncbi:hypothetical protein GTO27_13400 [Candidatus Bathyarchaeota archaeon]|nr:hypothetical protein [Candidatus Bathyarchaeota archaeon]
MPRRDNSQNPVTWGYGMGERGLQKEDIIEYKGRRWKVKDYTIMVINGHFALEIYIQDMHNENRTDVITSDCLITAVEWFGPVSVSPNVFEVEEVQI